MEPEQPEQDFVKRTLKLIEQYDKHRRTLPNAQHFEETLLVNCLIGLLVLPKERWSHSVKKIASQKLDEWSLPTSTVDSWGTSREGGKEPNHDLGEFSPPLEECRLSSQH
jgi:hypothetical protein